MYYRIFHQPWVAGDACSCRQPFPDLSEITLMVDVRTPQHNVEQMHLSFASPTFSLRTLLGRPRKESTHTYIIYIYTHIRPPIHASIRFPLACTNSCFVASDSWERKHVLVVCSSFRDMFRPLFQATVSTEVGFFSHSR